MLPQTAKVLVVDDMSTMRKLIKKSLSELGYTNVVEAVDGEDAFTKITDALKTNAPVAMVLSDWNMPKMKGIDLLIKVRGTNGTKALPFILLTAESEKDQVAVAVKAGVSEYLLKPFTKDQLSEKIKAATTRKAA
jgi:two-component system, chemotaxis family, chemotaxis protein CheY